MLVEYDPQFETENAPANARSIDIEDWENKRGRNMARVEMVSPTGEKIMAAHHCVDEFQRQGYKIIRPTASETKKKLQQIQQPQTKAESKAEKPSQVVKSVKKTTTE